MVAKSGREARRQKWEGIISDQEKSGKSVKEFCGGLGIKPSAFWYWRKNIHGGRKSLMVPSPGNGFVGVQCSEGKSLRLTRILFAQGMVLEMSELPDPMWLSRLAHQL